MTEHRKARPQNEILMTAPFFASAFRFSEVVTI